MNVKYCWVFNNTQWDAEKHSCWYAKLFCDQ